MISLEPLLKKNSPLCKCDGNDIKGAKEASTPATTKEDTDFWLSIFYDFCSEKEIAIDLKTCTPKQFDDTLCKFYVGLRNKTGDQYKSPLIYQAGLSSVDTWPKAT